MKSKHKHHITLRHIHPSNDEVARASAQFVRYFRLILADRMTTSNVAELWNASTTRTHPLTSAIFLQLRFEDDFRPRNLRHLVGSI